MLQSVPQWVYPDARIDLDFANDRYWGGYVTKRASGVTAEQMKSVTQGGTLIAQYAPDIYGNLIAFPSGVMRITSGYGSWAEGNYTNYALWSRDFTNVAWVKTTMTAAKDQPSADLPNTANTASSLLATAPLATAIQTIVQGSTTFVNGAWVKRLVGTGTISLISPDGTTLTNITSLINTSTYTWVQAPVQTLANPSIGFQISISGDKIAVDHAQCENSPLFATTPIPTTTASVARGVDEPAISDPGGTRPGDGVRLIRNIIVTSSPWSMLAIGSGNGYVGGNNFILSDGGLSVSGLAGTNNAAATGRFVANGSTIATSGNTGNVGLYNINKVAGRANGNKNSVCLNGGAVASSANTTPITPIGTVFTHCGIGNRGAGDNPLNGFISRLVFWNKEITDGQMAEFSR